MHHWTAGESWVLAQDLNKEFLFFTRFTIWIMPHSPEQEKENSFGKEDLGLLLLLRVIVILYFIIINNVSFYILRGAL